MVQAGALQRNFGGFSPSLIAGPWTLALKIEAAWTSRVASAVGIDCACILLSFFWAHTRTRIYYIMKYKNYI